MQISFHLAIYYPKSNLCNFIVTENTANERWSFYLKTDMLPLTSNDEYICSLIENTDISKKNPCSLQVFL